MDRSEYYSLFMATDVACPILGIDPQVMLDAAGLGGIADSGGERWVTAGQYFDAWNTTAELSLRDDYIPHLGVAISRGPVIPVFFTLSCAPDLETGLMRLAQFKALLGPTRMRVAQNDSLLRVEYESVDDQITMPPSLGALQMICLVEDVRGATAHHIQPAAAGFHGTDDERRMIASHLGVMPEPSDVAFVAFSSEDTKRRFISENPNLWADIEADLKLQMAARSDRQSMINRIRGTLVDLMPLGRTGAEDVADALGFSLSTLQRRLREEQTTYRVVLDAVRRDMAIRYLTKTTLNAQEIAAVLAYTDANSFSRSFRRWMGMAPLQFRRQADGKRSMSKVKI